ncbi:hypothetical protein GCM10019997_16570 [Prevotella corporis]
MQTCRGSSEKDDKTLVKGENLDNSDDRNHIDQGVMHRQMEINQQQHHGKGKHSFGGGQEKA